VLRGNWANTPNGEAIGPRDEWGQMAGVVTVPEGAGFIVPLLNGISHRSEDDATCTTTWWSSG